MKLYFWMLLFCGALMFSIFSLGKLSQNFSNDASVLQKKNIDLVNVAPVCLDRSAIPNEELHWLYMPQNSSELATSEYYSYLSGQLITSGAVNASDCPLGGLWSNGYANACGLEKTRDASLYLQNVYDDEILAAGKGLGVPPIMVKQLIRYESQFWPVQMGQYHFGLGHLTDIGASNALTRSVALSSDAYANLPPGSHVTSTVLSSQLLSMMNAACSTCPYKIDVPKAEQSIVYLAEVLLGYCRQTSQIVYNATKKNPGNVVDYATIWKLTLLNYNAGPFCVYNAVTKSYQSGDANENGKLTWGVIVDATANDTSCARGVPYVENITQKYYDFGTTP
ncbi:MAG: hypothetical protein PHQ36_05005 [Anaerolineales bacterium]|nr:hypothetical protein [Anaerolineales bacterium]